MLSIVCWKWSGATMGKRVEYSAEHVNTLAKMVDRWLKMPHEIVCVTDDPTGIDGGIRIVPLWDDLRHYGRCFCRLKAFDRDMADILGEKIVSLDLDVVVVGELDSLFDRTHDFMAWADPSRITPYCGSQWMLKIGSHPEVYEEFDIDEHSRLKPDRGWFGSDQAWMALKLPNSPTWTARTDGVLSMKGHLAKVPDTLRAKLKMRIKALGPPQLPPHARIVHFHGLWDPSMKWLQDMIPWIPENWC